MKVLVSDPIPDEAIAMMKNAGIDVDVMTSLSQEDLIKVIPDYDGLIVRSGTKVTAEVIEAAKNLRIIGRAGAGVDNIDIKKATEKGIVVVNAPGGNSVSTAELAIAMIFAVARKIPQADRSVKEGKWERKKFIGTELRGKTLGVIGLGRVGYEVAKRAKMLEMHVLAYDPYISEEKAKEIGVEILPFEDVLRKSDFITIHVPKTKETVGMFSKREFELMKDGAYIINCARGGIVDEKALYESLINGKLAGAGLDVYENEPPGDNPLLKLDNVVTTPHIGASTKEAQISVGLTIAGEIINFSKGLPARNAVNLPSLEPTAYEKIMPYMLLAEKMGRIASARLGNVIKAVRITYKGEISGYETDYITRSFLMGLLGEILGSNINLVSCVPVARERKIRIEESKSETSEYYSSILEVYAEGDEKSITLEGTCFGKDDYRILKIDRYKVDFIPKGNYIISLHEDKPGVIGRVGTLFGENNINIAGMIVGRHGGKGGIQLMLLLVDDVPSKDVLEQMVKLDGIIDATYIEL
ncbi:D-3-phosphoglycerate dehydrogenase [Archaeoglobus sulfaticallidus PM70-1]|uniref:D-3-phosphoglycerate dehydrogenase n=1 Tax=Archaeoglobus sulfaticallidus PM70-1 TaxID=387631 RepID=N0BCN5_9EURY|nr:phosphoglycerate dehydrogenase [Archaeoglobus sulfaticallidus]AGK60773.1 D-3-phosphoglycerate dehydrogenase [Archaeoglobus sulfaticallidus PM70-1]